MRKFKEKSDSEKLAILNRLLRADKKEIIVLPDGSITTDKRRKKKDWKDQLREESFDRTKEELLRSYDYEVQYDILKFEECVRSDERAKLKAEILEKIDEMEKENHEAAGELELWWKGYAKGYKQALFNLKSRLSGGIK